MNKETVSIKVTKKTRQRLKIAAAKSEQSIWQLVEKLTEFIPQALSLTENGAKKK